MKARSQSTNEILRTKKKNVNLTGREQFWPQLEK